MSPATPRPEATARALAGRPVCVAGLGVSGPPAARALLQHGARVTVIEGRDEAAEPEGAVARDAARLREQGARVLTGTTELPPDCELVVTSPGWRPDAAPLRAARDRGIEVIGDVELAWRLRPHGQRWLAVTGTNGKTTTVRMLEAMLRAAGQDARAVGNVGTSVVEEVGPGSAGLLAVELSSFQLHWSTSLRPEGAVVLNLAADHVDWHGDIHHYAAAKARIYAPGTRRVANLDDSWSPHLAAEYGDPTTPLVGYTLGPPQAGQLGVADGQLLDRSTTPELPLAPVAEVQPAAPHNVANALAAAALARGVGVAPAAVRAGLRDFTPEPHRIAGVARLAGVDYVDDSKATNPHAAAASLRAFDSVVWLAGGLLKGAADSELDALVRAAADRLRGVVLLGADRARLAAALARQAPQVPVVDLPQTGSSAMTEAVRRGTELATRHGAGTVLLAPAAASMDMFTDYRARGAAFAAAVTRLAAG